MNCFVYVIKNSEGKIYIGQTWNIEKRIIEHNEIGSGYTAKFRPWKLIYAESFSSRTEAIKRERYLKSGAGRDWMKRNIRRA